ncbi:MFS transporter [Nocardioides sp.]|jgi:hypothetical protein|uniref:MFS transporter n=1 Tax=Nocardioides sp. TaxID=35761 RepID=UPI002BF50659|nr:MFS transporter [Nocardioides sp.]HVX54494.1 MFS transporter [Nocardioides sp.]
MPGTSVAGSYAALMRRHGVARTFGLALAGRLTYGLLPLTLLFTVQQATGSFATAATAGALNGFAALSMPVKSRAIDRHGQRVVLPLIAVTAAVVLGSGVVLARSGVTAAPAWWALGLAVGLASPPLGPCMRAQWRALVPDHRVPAAYALDAVGEETLYLLGPVLAAGLLAVAPAYAGLPVAAVLLVVGAAGLAASPVAAGIHVPVPRHAGAGPLRHRRFRGLLGVMAAVGAVSATIYAGIAARALAAGHPSYAGLSEAGVACGSVIGGLVWGRLRPSWTWRQSLTCLLAFLGATLLAASLVDPYGPFTASLAFAGLALSPTYVVAYRASDLLVDRAEVVEAGTWVNTATNLGISLGGAASGLLVGRAGAHAPTWAGAVIALAGVAMIVGRRGPAADAVTGARPPRRASDRSG